ncbi:thioredoxin [candidate division KSB1 bacterium]|nr:thioredoxin [candidate division KSB1 bacterium]
MATINLSQENFQDTLSNNDIVMIDFWAEWCGPCKMFGPIFEKASEKHQDIAFAKVDTEKQRDLAGAFGIQSIPTLAIFRDQIMLYKNPGALPENALEDLIKQVRNLDMDEVRKEIAKHEAEHGHDHDHDHNHDHDHEHHHHH